jgi:dTDP-4-amino-4,6-dideoxygalactose transaminase
VFRIGQEEIDELIKVIQRKKLFRVNDCYQEVVNFEKELAYKCGVKYALCVSGGTAALTCALVGLGIGPGDEVLVPAYTFMATAAAVVFAGAVPVLTEIDESMTIDVKDIETKMSKDVKAIIPVHMAGFPADMDKIMKFKNKYGLKILEDACQSVGGSYKGKRLGSLGDVGAYSFNDYKIISSGEGGALLTDDRKIYERGMIYHDGGAAFRPYAGDFEEKIFLGTQYRVGELTGAVLRVQLSRLDMILADLRRVKHTILNMLADIPNIRNTPSNDPDGDCATTLSFVFDNSDIANAFASAEGIEGYLPINSGKHVYSNWEPLLSGRVSHNPFYDPFKLPRNKKLRIRYTHDMCPKTIDILSRTVYISLHCDWDDEKIEKKVNSCIKAFKAS